MLDNNVNQTLVYKEDQGKVMTLETDFVPAKTQWFTYKFMTVLCHSTTSANHSILNLLPTHHNRQHGTLFLLLASTPFKTAHFLEP